jgi:hypothetical protein
MTDLNLTAAVPQTRSADVLDPFKIIDDMVDLRIQMAQLEQQIRELQPLFFAACFMLDQAKIDRSRAIISRKLTPAQWTYTAEILDQEVLFKQLRKQFQQDHEPSSGRDTTWIIRLLFTQLVGSPR